MNRVTAIIGVVALGGGLIVTSSQHAAAFDPVPSTVPGAATGAPLASEAEPAPPNRPIYDVPLDLIQRAAQIPFLPPVLVALMPLPLEPDLELTLDLPRRTTGEDLDVVLDTPVVLPPLILPGNLFAKQLSGQCYVPPIDPPPTVVPAADDAIFDRVATQGT